MDVAEVGALSPTAHEVAFVIPSPLLPAMGGALAESGGMKARYFPYDAFLSHNQNDGSHVIRDDLVRLGATTWHDGYADITDRLVQERVRSGIVKSRYVCVCIGHAFRDSEWVRVEYRAGLEKECRDTEAGHGSWKSRLTFQLAALPQDSWAFPKPE